MTEGENTISASPRANPWVIRLLFIGAALPAILPLWIILRDGVNLIFWDEWDFVGIWLKAHEHALSWADFTLPHNEHRVFLPRLVYLIVGLLTHGNVKAIMLLQWPLVCGISAGLLWLMLRTEKPCIGLALRWFAVNAMLFSLGAVENWVFGLGIMNVMAMAFTVAAVLVASSQLAQWLRIGLAIACTIAASFSAGGGLPAWVLAGAVLFWFGSRDELKAKRWPAILWIVATIVCVIVYRWGLTVAPPLERLPTIAPILSDRVGYLLTFLGNLSLYTHNFPTMITIGAILMILYLLAMAHFLHRWFWRRDFENARPMLAWLAIGGITLSNALLAATFRADLGLDQATSSRYVTFAIYLPISLVGLLPLIVRDIAPKSPMGRLLQSAPSMLAILLLVPQLFGLSSALRNSELTRLRRLHGRALVMFMNVIPDAWQLAGLVYPDEPELMKRAAKVNAIGYLDPVPVNTNDARALQETSPGAGWLEAVQNAEGVPGLVRAEGWAVLPRARRSAPAVVLTYDDENLVPRIFAISRELKTRLDVVAQTGEPNYQLSGWQANFPAALLPPNLRDIRVQAWAVDADAGKLILLNGEFHVKRSE